MANLTDRQRAAVELRFGLIDGRPIAGVALHAALGVAQGSVHDRMTAALRKLAGAVGADPDRCRIDRAEGITFGKLKGGTPKRGRQPGRSARKQKSRKRATPAAAGGAA